MDEKRTDLQTRIYNVQRQLNELRDTGNRAFKTVTVRVADPTAGPLDMILAYTMPGASWAPNYDARITGEDWQDVALTLSTARPARGGAAPKLRVWECFDPITLEARAREQAMAEQERRVSMRKVASAPMAMGLAFEMAPPEQDAQIAQATVEAGATTATFRIATAASIPSDNSPQKVPVTTAKLKAEPA